MLLDILASVAIIAGIIALVAWLEGHGRKSAENSHMKKVLDDVQKAKAARDALQHDADAANRVRDRFTR